MNNEERQFERALNPEEQHIDALLSNAMAVPMPTGLEERITSASLQQLAEACDQVLEQQLDHAFAIPAPEQLTTRIYNASVGDLRNGQPAVIARINRGAIWREVLVCLTDLSYISIVLPRRLEQRYKTYQIAGVAVVLSSTTSVQSPFSNG